MRDTETPVPFVPLPQDSAVLDRLAAPAGSSLTLPRVLLVFAHPDDEVLAIGARLERLSASRLLTVTDGTPRDGADARHHGFSSTDSYREARRRELDCALHDAGLTGAFIASWMPPFPSPIADQTAALHLSALVHLIVTQVQALAPDTILTHPYEGGHPDHDACAFAVHAALRLLQSSSQPRPSNPLLCEAPFYHAGANGFMRTGAFLPYTSTPATRVCLLSPEEQAKKRRRLACFRSQTETLAQFAVDQELFRIAPAYDFAAPPHPGQLFYEQFPWGMTGARFRSLASEALNLFGLQTANVRPSAPMDRPLP